MHTCLKLLDETQLNSVLMSYVNKLLWIDSATAERTFSAMCELKNCIRA